MVQNYRDNRILWIDWAKSIGMFLVILGHCHIRESEQIVTQYIYSFHRWYIHLGMSVVLIASSFVLCGYNGFVSLASCDIFSSLTYCFCYISILIINKECPLIFGLKGIRN